MNPATFLRSKAGFLVLGLFFCSTPMIAATKSGSCSALSFENFLSHYAEDKTMQLKHAKYPLTIIRIHGSHVTVEPLAMKASLEKRLARAPFYPSKSQRKRHGLNSIRIINRGKNKKLVSIARDGTDDQTDFLFVKAADQCWYLSRIVYSSY